MACVMHSGSPIITWTIWVPPQVTIYRTHALPTYLSKIQHQVRCIHIDLHKTKVSCKRQHQIRSRITLIRIISSLSKITFTRYRKIVGSAVAQCVVRWTSTPEARGRIRVSTQINYYRADTVLWHKKDSNMACVMRSGFAIVIWTIRVPHKERYAEFMHSP
jgi:hypothetical protein